MSRNWYWIPAEEDVIDFPNGTWYYTPVERFADLTALTRLQEATGFAAALRVCRERGLQRFRSSSRIRSIPRWQNERSSEGSYLSRPCSCGTHPGCRR